MNRFKKAIQSAKMDKSERCSKMEELSSKMNRIIGLTQDELEEANHEDVSFNVPGYSISVRRFPDDSEIPKILKAIEEGM